MKMVRKIMHVGVLAGLLLGGLTACNQSTPVAEVPNLTQYVDPYIGSGDHGHVFVGANVPYGMVQLGPTNIHTGWDWVSGYHYSDSTIFGFSHLHLSGTGIGDLLDILVMPTTGSPKLAKGDDSGYDSGMYSLFNRKNEVVKAGYYGVKLDRYNIGVELAATERVGFHKYTFPKADDAAVVINLADALNWDESLEGYLVQEDETTVSGYRYSKGWAADQKVFFTAKFSKPLKGFELYEGETLAEGKKGLTAKLVYGRALFDTEENEDIYLKLAVSPVSIENAKLNMEEELPEWDFNATVTDADVKWNNELQKAIIESTDQSVLRNFYTAHYHTMIAPSLFCDVNNDYRGADGKNYNNEIFKAHTTFSLWDTYRAAHPLMTIIHPEQVPDMINSMLYIFKEQGKLPVWHLVGNETDCMVGNPGIPVVADAYLKGFEGFDRDLAYQALKESALQDDRGLDQYKVFGYIPYDKASESVASGLEYALADWAVAQVAKERGETEDYEYFLNRSNSFKSYFDKSIGFMRGIDSKGNFRPGELDPYHSKHREDDYTEGNAWHYRWLVPQNVNGLVDLMGGEDVFIQNLDTLFLLSTELSGDASPDISGLIGQYVQGNEPSHHILYMYPYVGQQWKTAQRVREVLTTLYFDAPAGLSGNEDCGQMSAWYMLSALGFYQVEPAGGRYIFGSPIVDKATLNVGNGNVFTILANNNSKENIYIQSVTLNGQPYTKSFIEFDDIAAGGELVFEMGNTPSQFGVNLEDRPVSVQ
ncbi:MULTISPECIES: GH92 family glycosyl hydrolase [Bacteroides]|uniref:GH92 family glycosyl hydrolase n=1 Tax=Bacteroides TaxID=816 RepID=UPI001E04560D|nr:MULTISPECIES: GH92 family glycosyl hydrolase [Bacteroides]HJD93073.1 GH92 family glycosyl hydrolase [Bacteroides coprosuis]